MPLNTYLIIHTDFKDCHSFSWILCCPLTRTNGSHTHTKQRHWWFVYYFTRFHRVMCTEVHVSCMLYATESLLCSNWWYVVSVVAGVQAHMHVHFKLFPNSFEWVSHKQLQSAHLITSHNNRVNLSANVQVKSFSKTKGKRHYIK